MRTLRRPGPVAGVLAVGTLAAGVLAGCGVDVGPSRSESREIAGVSAVELATAGDLTVAHADRPALRMTAPETLLDRLTSDVHDGTLVLGRERGAWWLPGQVRYALEVDTLERLVVTGSGDVAAASVTGDDVEIEVVGSGDVLLAGVDADSVTVTVSGSGDVEVAGSATRLTVVVRGSGEVRAAALTAHDADVEVSGSGGVEVDARDTLAARISGSGSVTYSGDPRVSQDVSGSGSVRQADA